MFNDYRLMHSLLKILHCLQLLTNLGGTHMVHLYKDQFEWLEGTEYLERVRLRESVRLERIITKCCGTPIGYAPKDGCGSSMFTVHHELLSYTTKWKFTDAWWRLNVRTVPEVERHWNDTPPTACVVSESLPPSFVLRTFGRALCGMLFKRGNPDPMKQIPEDYTVIGLNEKKA
jgi:hypothetical protein